jgi:hypothetical protein
MKINQTEYLTLKHTNLRTGSSKTRMLSYWSADTHPSFLLVQPVQLTNKDSLIGHDSTVPTVF